MVATPSNVSVPFPSPSNQPNWLTVPNLNAPLMDPVSGTVGIPWYQFFNFLATRSAYVNILNGDTTALQSAVSILQTQVGELETAVTTLQNQVLTLQGQVATLQGQVTTLQAAVVVLQAQIVVANNNIANLLTKTNDSVFVFGSGQTVSTAPSMAGLAIAFTPTINARHTFNFDATVNMSAAGSASCAVRYGTGTPPAPGSALTGTAVSASTLITNITSVGLSLSGLITGIVPGTPYWLDLATSTLTGGNLVIGNPTALVNGLINPN